MPVASGAAGRVDVGVDTRTIWTADGLKKTKPPNRNHDSYLERYQELKKGKKNKTDLLQDNKQDNIDTSNHENDGAEEARLQKTASRGNSASEKPPSGERSKKSQLCVIL